MTYNCAYCYNYILNNIIQYDVRIYMDWGKNVTSWCFHIHYVGSLLSNSRLARVFVLRQICMDGFQYVEIHVGITITTFVFIELKWSRDFHPAALSSWLAR